MKWFLEKHVIGDAYKKKIHICDKKYFENTIYLFIYLFLFKQDSKHFKLKVLLHNYLKGSKSVTYKGASVSLSESLTSVII